MDPILDDIMMVRINLFKARHLEIRLQSRLQICYHVNDRAPLEFFLRRISFDTMILVFLFVHPETAGVDKVAEESLPKRVLWEWDG